MYRPEDLYNKKILCGALDWGMGHLTRMVCLLQQINPSSIVILSTPEQIDFYKFYFPDAQYKMMPSLNWKWSGNHSPYKEFWSQRNKWFKTYRKEQKMVGEIINNNSIDFILSDNRYGLYSKKIPSILLTHQLNFSVFGKRGVLSQLFLKRLLKPFSCVWVPDFSDDTLALAGPLSRNNKLKNIFFLGPLKRFKWEIENEKKGVLIMLTGPEPQKKEWFLSLQKVLKHLESPITVVSVNQNYSELKNNWIWKSAPSEEDLKKLLQQSSFIITRSGYTSVMELFDLKGTEVILVPTPRQYEQEFIGNYLNEKYNFSTLQQSDLEEILGLIQRKGEGTSHTFGTSY